MRIKTTVKAGRDPGQHCEARARVAGLKVHTGLRAVGRQAEVGSAGHRHGLKVRTSPRPDFGTGGR
jgi:hypothetical protein